MALEIFDNNGDYLEINADGSLNVSSSDGVLSGQLANIVTYTKTQSDINISSRIIETYGTDTYIALAPAGSETSASVWQVQKIDTDGSRQWADGDTNFDNAASSDLSGLTFSY